MSGGTTNLDLTAFVFERQDTPFNVLHGDIFHSFDVGIGHCRPALRVRRERAMAFAGAALVFGKHVNFGRQKVAIGLFARGGAEIHSRENIGKFNRRLAANHGLIGEQSVSRHPLGL